MGILQTIKSKLSSISSTKYIDLKKNYTMLMDTLLRPRTGSQFSQGVHVIPIFPFSVNVLYDLAYNSDVLTSVHNSLRRELFRNGYDLSEADNTDEEETDSEEETEAAGMSRKDILDFLENINENRQTVIDVLMEIEDDFSVMDDAFMLFLFEYSFKNNGEIIPELTLLKEVLRGDPRYMGLVMNKYDMPAMTDDMKKISTCPEHRDQFLENKEKCPQCGKKTYRAHYFSEREESKIYYFKEEVVFRSKYRPGKRRGFPPVLTVWQKARTLLFMDKYVMELYDGQRPPKHGLFFKTSNQEALMKAMEEARANADEHPHHPMVLAIPDDSNGNKFVEFVDFMKNMDELQHTEMRNEYRRQIGSVYGVEPVFQGDVSQGGGLNNEGMQITVTNRAVEYGQGIHNEYFLKRILEALRVKGWNLTLNPSEEQDEMAKLDRQRQTLENGEIAARLGLESEYDEDVGEVIIKTGSLEKPETETPGGFNPFGNSEQSGDPGFEAMLSKARDRPPFSKISDKLKREMDSFLKKFKRKPTKKELKGIITDINKNLSKEMQASTIKLFRRNYSNEADKVSKELGINFVFDAIDENALKALATQKVLSQAYDGISKEMTKKLNEVIESAFEKPAGLSLKQIRDKMKEITDVSDYRIETIARTEVGKVTSAARLNSYKKEEDFDTFKFKWIGPNDHRTTITSKRIKSRTKNGVSWDELIKIVTQESAKEFPEWSVDKNYPVSHYNSRHIFTRIVTPATKKSIDIEKENMTDIELEFAIKKKEADILKQKEELIKDLSGGMSERH